MPPNETFLHADPDIREDAHAYQHEAADSAEVPHQREQERSEREGTDGNYEPAESSTDSEDEELSPQEAMVRMAQSKASREMGGEESEWQVGEFCNYDAAVIRDGVMYEGGKNSAEVAEGHGNLEDHELMLAHLLDYPDEGYRGREYLQQTPDGEVCHVSVTFVDANGSVSHVHLFRLVPNEATGYEDGEPFLEDETEDEISESVELPYESNVIRSSEEEDDPAPDTEELKSQVTSFFPGIFRTEESVTEAAAEQKAADIVAAPPTEVDVDMRELVAQVSDVEIPQNMIVPETTFEMPAEASKEYAEVSESSEGTQDSEKPPEALSPAIGEFATQSSVSEEGPTPMSEMIETVRGNEESVSIESADPNPVDTKPIETKLQEAVEDPQKITIAPVGISMTIERAGPPQTEAVTQTTAEIAAERTVVIEPVVQAIDERVAESAVIEATSEQGSDVAAEEIVEEAVEAEDVHLTVSERTIEVSEDVSDIESAIEGAKEVENVIETASGLEIKDAADAEAEPEQAALNDVLQKLFSADMLRPQTEASEEFTRETAREQVAENVASAENESMGLENAGGEVAGEVRQSWEVTRSTGAASGRSPATTARIAANDNDVGGAPQSRLVGARNGIRMERAMAA